MHIVRKQIVENARTWLGTRFHHQGRVKKNHKHTGGCDCLGLLMGVAEELALCSPVTGRPLVSYDQTDYSYIPDGQAFYESLGCALHGIGAGEIQPGDIGLFTFDHNPQHVAIISDYGEELGLIHCYAQARKVVEHRLDDSWKRRMVAAFRICNVAEEVS